MNGLHLPENPTESEVDAYVIQMHDEIANIMEDGGDVRAASIVRRAIRLFVAERDVTFDEALAALLGRAKTHRERADITRAGKFLRDVADALASDDNEGSSA